jgi:predicted Rossmann fold flavoprotein
MEKHDDDVDKGHCEEYDLIIIGAGPSGLFCAVNSAQIGRKILLLEKKDSPGRKLLISGCGQCNITHEGDIAAFLEHYGDGGRFLRPALLGFTNCDLVSFFKEKGLAFRTENGGKIFPKTMRSRDVLDVLMKECESKGVQLRCGQKVRSVSRSESGFTVHCGNCSYRSPLLVIATGGSSYPATGSTGDGYRFARELGHSMAEIGPALTPVYIRDYPFAGLAGISIPGLKVSIYRQKKIREGRGDILFTHQGLSGPGILDLSRFIRAGDTLKISFVPEERRQDLEDWLLCRMRDDGSRRLRSMLAELPFSAPLPARLIDGILEISDIPRELRFANLSREMRNSLVDNLTALPLVVSELGGFDVAMVTRGGVALKEVNPKTMESRLVKGLYLVGEVLDIDGDTGGYNLQAAFSTAMLAARSIKNRYQ